MPSNYTFVLMTAEAPGASGAPMIEVAPSGIVSGKFTTRLSSFELPEIAKASS